MADNDLQITIKTTADTAGAEQASAAIKDVKQAAGDVGRDGPAAFDKLDEAARKATVTKRDLRGVLRGLSMEFPILGRLAYMAMNPIAAAAAGIAAGFMLWRNRVNELTRALGGVETKIKLPPVVDVQNVAKSYETLAAAVAKAVAELGSIEAASKRQQALLQQEIELQKQLLQARKNLELAGATTAEQREEIETRYARAGLALEERGGREAIAAKFREAFDLKTRGEAKLAAAGGRIPSEDAEQTLVERWATRVQEAEAALATARARMADISTAQNLGIADPRRLYYDNLLRARYGYGVSYDEMRAVEQLGIDQALTTLEAARRFRSSRADWAMRRKLREEGLADISRSVSLFGEARAEEDLLNRRIAVGKEVGSLEEEARAAEARKRAEEEARAAEERERRRRVRDGLNAVKGGLSAVDTSDTRAAVEQAGTQIAAEIKSLGGSQLAALDKIASAVEVVQTRVDQLNGRLNSLKLS